MRKEMKRIPRLRYPEFKEEWQTKRIGTFIRERKTFSNPDIPLYSLTIKNGVVPKTKQYERSFLVKSKEDAYKEMHPSDFAFNPMNLRFGALAMYKGEFNVAVSRYYNIFYCNSKVVPKYLEYYLTSYNMIQYYERMSTGTLEEKKRVHYLDFINFKKLFPTLPEQQKIASFLSAVDQKIDQLTCKKELLSQYKKDVMQKIFSQEIRFRDDKGHNFLDWQEKRLGDIAYFRNGKAHEKEINKEGKYVVVNSKFISSEGKVQKRVQYQICPLHKSDVVMVMSDVPRGKALAKCYSIEIDGLYTLNQRICALTSTKNSNKFIFYRINRNTYFLKFDSGVGQTNLRKDDIKNCPIIIPETKAEQQKIATFLTNIDKKIEATQSQLSQTQIFKKGLLQQMFV
jgi:type I restriction enzyme S subunit